MIRLEALPDSVAKKHLNALKDEIDTRLRKLKTGHKDYPNIDKLPYSKGVITYLLKGIRPRLLGDITALRDEIKNFSNKFVSFDAVLATTPQSRKEVEKEFVKALKWAYSYEFFCDKKAEWNAYDLVKEYGLRICPYCHTSHLNYHDGDELEMRPPLDHFFPRSRYPFLGVSLHNLIPSCHQCNSSVKSSRNPIDFKIAHPHEFVESELAFELATPAPGLKPAWAPDATIKIVATATQAELFVDFFRLRERYPWYLGEIDDLRDRVKHHCDATGALRRMLAGNDFVYGFATNKSRDRMLGRCIVDITTQLINSYSE